MTTTGSPKMRLSDMQRGQRVEVLDAYQRPLLAGVIVGDCAVQAYKDHKASLSVAVALDRGFYSEDRQSFVSVLLVHPDNLSPEPPR